MDTLIVTDSAKLNSLVTQTLTTKAKYEAMLHSCALSVMLHSVKHGDCSVMNRLFFGLNANEQRAFRTYWRRVSWEITGKADVELVKYVSDENSPAYGFTVLTMDQNQKATVYRKRAGEFITDRLASDNPGKWSVDATGKAETAKAIVPFYQTDNFRDALTDFGDRNLFKQVRQMVKVSTGDVAPGGGKVKVSRSALLEIEKCLAALDKIVNNDANVEREKEEAKAAKSSAAKTQRKADVKAPPQASASH